MTLSCNAFTAPAIAGSVMVDGLASNKTKAGCKPILERLVLSILMQGQVMWVQCSGSKHANVVVLVHGTLHARKWLQITHKLTGCLHIADTSYRLYTAL